MSSIEFCDKCANLLYFEGDHAVEEDILLKVCKNCGTRVPIDVDELIQVGDNSIVDTSTLLRSRYLNNKYLKYDNTLPRVEIACPNKECSGSTSLYIVYDEVNMCTLYKCLTCDEWHE